MLKTFEYSLKRLKFLWIIIICIPFMSFGQRAYLRTSGVSIPENDTVVLRLGSYMGEQVKWQFSADEINWHDIENANADTLMIIAEQASYYRAQVLAGDCEPFYSDTTRVSVYKLNDNVLIIDYHELDLISTADQIFNNILIFSDDITNLLHGVDVLVKSEGQSFVKRIHNWHYDNGKTTIRTQPGTISDVYKSIDLAQEIKISYSNLDKSLNNKWMPLNVTHNPSIKGLTLKNNLSPYDLAQFSFSLPSENDQPCATDCIEVTINEGNISFQPVLTHAMVKSPDDPEVRYYGLTSKDEIKFDLSAMVRVGSPIKIVEGEKHIDNFKIGHIPVGVLNMEVICNLKLKFSGEFEQPGSMEFGFDGEYETKLGAIYDWWSDPRWKETWLIDTEFETKGELKNMLPGDGKATIAVEISLESEIAGNKTASLLIEPSLIAESFPYSPGTQNFALLADIKRELDYKNDGINENGTPSNIPSQIEREMIYIKYFDVNWKYPPRVNTVNLESTGPYTAGFTAVITSTGGYPVTDHGVILEEFGGFFPPPIHYSRGPGDVGEYQIDITGLKPSTKYFVWPFVTTQHSTKSDIFRLLITENAIETLPVKDIDVISATFQAWVKDMDAEIPFDRKFAEVGFCIDKKPSYSVNDCNQCPGTYINNSELIQLTIDTLKPGTKYFVRGYVRHDDEFFFGNQVEFLTDYAIMPHVETLEVTDIEKTSAKLWGQINRTGNLPVKKIGFEINNNRYYLEDASPDENGIFYYDVDDLSFNKTYSVFAFAENIQGRVYGQEVIFLTEMHLNIIRGGPESTQPLAVPKIITGINANPYNSNLDQWTGQWQAPQAIYDQGEFVNDPDFWSNIQGRREAGSTWRNPSPGNGYGILVVDLNEKYGVNFISVFQMFSDGKTTHIEIFGHPEQTELVPDIFDTNWFSILAKSEIGPGENKNSYISLPTQFASEDLFGITRFVKIHAFNDGALGHPDFIELKGIKMYGEEAVPTVTTDNVTNITSSGAHFYATIINEGLAPLLKKGFLIESESLSVVEYPVINDFNLIVDDLELYTHYSVRAFGENKYGIGFGNVMEFRTLPPENTFVLTLKSYPFESGILSGDGFYKEGDSVTIYANPHPEVLFLDWSKDNEIISTDLVYSFIMPGYNVTLTANFERKDPDNVVYGNGVWDSDGNFYPSVIIGNQEWMAKNLNTTRDANGNIIIRSCYDNLAENCDLYGGLYTPGTALNGETQGNEGQTHIQGICPAGWHLPSFSEWAELERYICNYLGNQDCDNEFPLSQSVWDRRTSRGTNEGNALKSCKQVASTLYGCSAEKHPRWESSQEGQGFNAFGFEALPGGYFSYSALDWNIINPVRVYEGIGYQGRWLTSTPGSSGYWERVIQYDKGWITRVGVFNPSYRNGGSIRCIKD